jgi:hypothetical protein
MDPVEVDEHLTNRSLKSLVCFTGLDLTNSADHGVIYKCFCDPAREKSAHLQYKILTADSDLFRRAPSSDRERVAMSQSPPLAMSPILKGGRGMLKKSWPLKYLVSRPALVVCFVDLDWNHPSWTGMGNGIRLTHS